MRESICCLYLGGLLDQLGLLLVLEAVVLDMFPQAAGVSVPLVASEHIALVWFLKSKSSFCRKYRMLILPGPCVSVHAWLDRWSC